MAEPEVPLPTAAPAVRGRVIAALALSAIVLVAASLAIGRFTAPVRIDPSPTSAEAGFARDMQVHHQQAVQLALMVRDLTDDPDIRLLAYDIATSQSQQAGQMYGWLADWGLPQAPAEPPMTWMSRPPLTAPGESHDHPAAPGEVPTSMPGYATPAQIAALAASRGVEAEIEFLRLMIAHHEGGVEMAQAVLERTHNTVVTDLATSIVIAQQSEIDAMQQLLQARTG